MTKKERQEFKELFSKYCRAEVNAGHCTEGACSFCPINTAYDKIFKQEHQGHEEGICPICGANVEYVGAKEIVDDSVVIDWVCPDCEAEGTECYDIVFGAHEDLSKADDTPYTDEELEGKDLECGEVCPICGGELEFHGDQDLTADYEGTDVGWTCTQCATRGTMVSNLVFSEHICNEDDAVEDEPANDEGDAENDDFVESMRYPFYKMLQRRGVDVEYTDVGLAVRHDDSLFGIIIEKC